MDLEVQVDKKMVEHPNHYNKGDRKECWDEMIEMFGVCETASFCVLSAYKYVYRAGNKSGNSAEQDIAKAKTYIAKAVEIKEKQEPYTATYRTIDKLIRTFNEYQMKEWLKSNE